MSSSGSSNQGSGSTPASSQPRTIVVQEKSKANLIVNGNNITTPRGDKEHLDDYHEMKEEKELAQKNHKQALNSREHRRFLHLELGGGLGAPLAPPNEEEQKRASTPSSTSARHIPPPMLNTKVNIKHSNELCHHCNSSSHFPNNSVSTTKYNVLSFLPLNLWEQFHKKGNLYFLLVAIISLTPLSPKTPIVSVAPLVLVLFVSAVKEAWEDWQRAKMDRSMNSSDAQRWQTSQKAFETVKWANLAVGDVILVQANQPIPADLLLLQSSTDQGIANIETSNLDGETNLKVKQAVPETWRIRTAELSAEELNQEGLGSNRNRSRAEQLASKWPLAFCDAVVESAPPNKKLDGAAWKGNLTFLHTLNQPIALGMTQFIPRGCTLRNTKWIIGLVLFTGVETKLMLNNRPAAPKRSNVDRIVDDALYAFFLLQFFLCSFGASSNYVWAHEEQKKHWYLVAGVDTSTDYTRNQAGLSWFTYLVLLDILIPISLYVSMELVKALQAWFINRDLDMYHAATDTPAAARTSNLNEELGQVSYIFSDKTGTLTCNIMNFVACSVDDTIYGVGGDGDDTEPDEHDNHSHPLSSSSSSASSAATTSTQKARIEPLAVPLMSGIPPLDADFPFKDSRLVRALVSNQGATGSNSLIKDHFLTLLATCHTVLPAFPKCSIDHVHKYEECGPTAPVVYEAASPDEKALVIAAKNSQYYFYHREPKEIPVGDTIIQGERVCVNILGTHHEFDILDSFEFTSERARMSVVLRDPRDNKIKIFSKGSDAKMFKLLSKESIAAHWQTQESHLEKFSRIGLRTLVCGYKIISQEDYLKWAARYKLAKAAIDRREEMVAECQNAIEEQLTLLGATAINDELQDGVPETIANLANAGIKIWVLTGDKVETAINIAHSCRLITPLMDAAGLITVTVDEKLTDAEAHSATVRQLEEAWTRVADKEDGSEDQAIVVSGAALTHVFSVLKDKKGREIPYEEWPKAEAERLDALRTLFLNVCKKCRAVVCCRVSPNQKGEVVSLVKKKLPKQVTLAIGDGANDTVMIRTAHIGVGISGMEGLQAVMASDYAIAQFRFLQKLLLVHGAWSYRRTSLLILYSFYKNVCLAMSSFWFAIYSGWSAQLFYDAYAGSVYNIFFTSIPILLAAGFNRDVSKETLMKYPHLYKGGLTNSHFNLKLLLFTVLEGMFHSVILYWGACFLFSFSNGDVSASDGKTHDLWFISTAMYTWCVVVVNGVIALRTTTWTWFHHFFIYASVVAWFGFIIVYCSLIDVTPDMYNISGVLFASPVFWLCTVLVPTACLIPKVAQLFIARTYFPHPLDIAAEIDRANRNNKGKDSGDDGSKVDAGETAVQRIQIKAAAPAPLPPQASSPVARQTSPTHLDSHPANANGGINASPPSQHHALTDVVVAPVSPKNDASSVSPRHAPQALDMKPLSTVHHEEANIHQNRSPRLNGATSMSHSQAQPRPASVNHLQVSSGGSGGPAPSGSHSHSASHSHLSSQSSSSSNQVSHATQASHPHVAVQESFSHHDDHANHAHSNGSTTSTNVNPNGSGVITANNVIQPAPRPSTVNSTSAAVGNLSDRKAPSTPSQQQQNLMKDAKRRSMVSRDDDDGDIQ